MQQPHTLHDLLGRLNGAVAVADPETWRMRYENERFSEWFPRGDAPDARLGERLQHDLERADGRINRGRPYRFDTEMRVGPRMLTLQVELRPETLAGEEAVVVECRNISKQKEAEYLLDSYSVMMERQARELAQEKQRAEKLLLNIMPRSVCEDLKEFGTTTPQSFDEASVLMLDIVGFTEMTESQEPGPLLAALNDVFTSFDHIVEHFRCERLKTIGDAYLAVAGVPERDPDHAINLARVALKIRRFLERRNAGSAQPWECRMGIGCGPVIGSIVGIHKYVYDIFGTAVNMSARLEARAEPGQILVCGTTCERIRDEFVVRSVGHMDLKGFGTQEVYALVDEARRGR